jgi:hypothetical protein
LINIHQTSLETWNLYYNQNENKHKDFSVLVDNLSQRKNDFMTENKTVDELVSRVHIFKDRANLATHTISIVPDEDDLLKYNVQHIFNLLSRLIR